MKNLGFTLGILFLGFMGGCGGTPSQEAKVATFLQSLMSSFIEANTTQAQAGGTSTTEDCPVSGSYTIASGTFGSIDLDNPGLSTIDSDVTFTACVFQACDTTITLDGTGTHFTMIAGQAQALSTGTTRFEVTVVSTNQAVTGLLNENITFSYELAADVSENTIGNLVVSEVSPAVPLVTGGRTYNASELTTLSDGC